MLQELEAALAKSFSAGKMMDFFIYIYTVKVKVIQSTSQLHGLYSPWNSPGKNTGVGCRALPPGDLPDPGIEPRSLHCGDGFTILSVLNNHGIAYL